MTDTPEGQASDPFGLKHLAKLGDAAASVINNIINHIAAVIGTPYDDLLTVVRARRRAKADTLLAKAEVDAEAYRRVALARADRKIDAATALHNDQLEARARQRLARSGVQQQENIEAITVAAIEHVIELEREGGVSVAPSSQPTLDWMAEFVDLCKNTSDTRMQDLWARVLAGEIRTPGSFSIRALLTLKTLFPNEAEQFRVACNFVLEREWIFSRSGRFGLQFPHYLSLASAGLIAPESDAGWGFKEKSNNVTITYEPYILLFDNKSEGQFFLPVWYLTSAGKELMQLITIEHDWNYIKELIKYQQSEGWHLKSILTPDGFPPPPEDLPTQFSLATGPEPEQS